METVYKLSYVRESGQPRRAALNTQRPRSLKIDAWQDGRRMWRDERGRQTEGSVTVAPLALLSIVMLNMPMCAANIYVDKRRPLPIRHSFASATAIGFLFRRLGL
ncbi:hypothetical protein J6590_000214 [Homalodisca vitripennis]|nr:hypothetical protein J6590_000214 [Homalodisca vitripennis]